jgi:hypothetical protein
MNLEFPISFNPEIFNGIDNINFKFILIPLADDFSNEVETIETFEQNRDSEIEMLEKYTNAINDKEDTSNRLLALVLACQKNISQQIVGLFDEEKIPEKSWEFTWLRIRDVLGNIIGRQLIDLVIFFDQLIELEHPPEDDSSAQLKIQDIGHDVVALTFYKTMEPYLKRSNTHKQ